MLEKTLESPLDSKEIKSVNAKGSQHWIFLEALMLKLQYFGHLMWWTNSLEKMLMMGKIEGMWRRGWHHWLNEHEFEQILRDNEEQGSLVCCNRWGHKKPDTTKWLIINISFLYLIYNCFVVCVQLLEQLVSVWWFYKMCWYIHLYWEPNGSFFVGSLSILSCCWNSFSLIFDSFFIMCLGEGLF